MPIQVEVWREFQRGFIGNEGLELCFLAFVVLAIAVALGVYSLRRD